MTKRSMQSPPANLPGIALMLAGALAPGLAVGQGVMQGFHRHRSCG
ncbi:hypothetical protein [Pseudomonas sp. KU43P]|nr:hypothetical protein [Pseudomonas sp. KU43P]